MSPLLASLGITDLYPDMIDAHFILDRIKNATGKFSRVWTQLIQHFPANRYIMLMKFLRDFSKRVASLRMFFILQKKRSTMLRMA